LLTALKTGMRQGELVALTWADVDLTAAVARVRRTFTDGIVHEPKNHERRDVDLTPEVVDLLGAWWGELGSPDDDRLVFPGDGRDGYLVNGTILKRELYPAMERAGVARVGPTGEKRTFHSLRHTFARVTLEHGAELTWLSPHLGHSSTAVTDGVYGHWSLATGRARRASARWSGSRRRLQCDVRA
jgi:integrase